MKRKLAIIFFAVITLVGFLILMIQVVEMLLHDYAHREMDEARLKQKLTPGKPTPPIIPRAKTDTLKRGFVIPEFSQISDCDSIVIADRWVGLSDIAPISAHYSIQKSGGAFRGKAIFMVGHDDHANTSVVKIEIPNTAIQSFLKMLSQTPVEKGTYKPRIQHTDDFPEIVVDLGVKKKSFVFGTSSQGEDHVPWRVKFEGEEYIINSDIPGKALAILKPYMKRDELQRLMEQTKAQLKNKPIQ
jgi:hypothetical protein